MEDSGVEDTLIGVLGEDTALDPMGGLNSGASDLNSTGAAIQGRVPLVVAWETEGEGDMEDQDMDEAITRGHTSREDLMEMTHFTILPCLRIHGDF